MIYLDAAATTKPRESVLHLIKKLLSENWYNPSALYSSAVHIKDEISNTRRSVAKFINSNHEEIFFTSGGSESNCWAIQGFVNYCKKQNRKPVVITSEIEHKSILKCVENISCPVIYVEVDSKGFVIIKDLKKCLMGLTKKDNLHDVLVSIQFANNEIGTIQHVKELSDLVHKYGGVFHTDAVQAFGHVPIDVKELGIDMLSASGHKIGTPKGIGILYRNKDINISPIIYGTQENGMRGGTENAPYIVGFGEAVRLCGRELAYRNPYFELTKKRDYFMSKLAENIRCKFNGSFDSRLPNNISVTFRQNITGEALIYLLDMCGIYISAGSACNSNSSEPSHVLQAIGLTEEEAMKTIRITIPEDITIEQIDKVIDEMQKQIKLITQIRGD